MTIASLASQFSDVKREDNSDDQSRTACRLGQTIWISADVFNNNPFDVYLNVIPTFYVPEPEYTAKSFIAANVVKRLDVVGPPSSAGSSISIMLKERFRFFVPANSSRSYAFFMLSEGLRFFLSRFITDTSGVLVPPGTAGARFYAAMGSPHALMTEKVEQDLEAVS